MKLFDLKNAGHWPTLLAAFLYFDFSFMVWTVLGPLGAQIGEKLDLSPEQKGLMVALPILVGAVLRILLGLLVDRVGAKNTGIMAQLVVITGLALAWIFGLPNYPATLLMGLVLGFAGASFAVALPQAGRWYPPKMQGVVMGLASAGNIGGYWIACLPQDSPKPSVGKTYLVSRWSRLSWSWFFTRRSPKRRQAR